MYENMRISDADRERVTSRLREHFAQGRLTQDELNERLAATLSAKTFGELRPIMADLPDPAENWTPTLPGWQGTGWQDAGWQAGWQGWQGPGWHGQPVRQQWQQPVQLRRGPRLLPLVMVVLFSMILLPSAGLMAFAFLKLAMFVWLVVLIASVVAGGRSRRAARYRAHSRWDR